MSQPFPPPPGSPPSYSGQGQLVLELRKPFGALSASMISPKVRIDGYPAPARWGTNVFPVPAGQRLVQVSSSYLWDYGQAQQAFSVAPGQSVQVHYSPPLLTLIGGRMGFERQKYAGALFFWIILGLVLAVLLAVLIGALVSGGGS